MLRSTLGSSVRPNGNASTGITIPDDSDRDLIEMFNQIQDRNISTAKVDASNNVGLSALGVGIENNLGQTFPFDVNNHTEVVDYFKEQFDYLIANDDAFRAEYGTAGTIGAVEDEWAIGVELFGGKLSLSYGRSLTTDSAGTLVLAKQWVAEVDLKGVISDALDGTLGDFISGGFVDHTLVYSDNLDAHGLGTGEAIAFDPAIELGLFSFGKEIGITGDSFIRNGVPGFRPNGGEFSGYHTTLSFGTLSRGLLGQVPMNDIDFVGGVSYENSTYVGSYGPNTINGEFVSDTTTYDLYDTVLGGRLTDSRRGGYSYFNARELWAENQAQIFRESLFNK